MPQDSRTKPTSRASRPTQNPSGNAHTLNRPQNDSGGGTQMNFTNSGKGTMNNNDGEGTQHVYGNGNHTINHGVNEDGRSQRRS
ncbi:hypothetical protein PM082_023743 [Marasmius tenuissimus]|nr:hypothetical protein PM082_023743 [Marasmius tenuissimus]